MYEDELYDIQRDDVRWEGSMQLRIYMDVQDVFNEFSCVTVVEYLVNNTRLGTNVKK